MKSHIKTTLNSFFKAWQNLNSNLTDHDINENRQNEKSNRLQLVKYYINLTKSLKMIQIQTKAKYQEKTQKKLQELCKKFTHLSQNNNISQIWKELRYIKNKN